jgi:hypothetical protein
MKNNIKTQSYFIKRLRDSGFVTIKLFDAYGEVDPRKWSIMVDPSGASVLITCYVNKETLGDVVFELNDGGNKFPKNFHLKTQSMEIIITSLIERGISQKDKDCSFQKKG